MRQRLAWVLALTPFVSVALWHLPQGFGIGAGDYAHYLLHARAILEGTPYSEIGYLFTGYNPFIGPPVQPPGLPLTLVVAFSVLGWNVLAARLLVFGLAISYLVAAGLHFARHESRKLGLAVALLAGLSPAIIHGSTQILTDLPFACFVWWIAVASDSDGEWDTARIAVVTALGLAAMSYRMAGIAIVPAMGLFGILNLRRLGARPLIPVGVWLTVGLLAFLGVLPGTTGLSAQLSNSPLSGLAIELKRFFAYRLALTDSLLYPFPSGLANDAYHLLAAPIVAIGLFAWLRRSWMKFLACFVVVYGAMLVTIDVAAVRYTWPLYPVFVFGLLDGLRIVALRLRPVWSRDRVEGLVLKASWVLAALTIGVRMAETPSALFSGILAREPDVVEVFERFREVETASSAGPVRVVFVKPRIFTLETRIPAMGLFSTDPTATIQELCEQGITHLILGDYELEADRQASMERAVDAQPSAFEETYSNQSFTVYRLDAEAAGCGG